MAEQPPINPAIPTFSVFDDRDKYPSGEDSSRGGFGAPVGDGNWAKSTPTEATPTTLVDAQPSSIREVSAPPKEEVKEESEYLTPEEITALSTPADDKGDYLTPEEVLAQSVPADSQDAVNAGVAERFRAISKGKPTIIGAAPELSMNAIFGDTAFGRMLELAGAGWNKGYGEDPLGVGSETQKTLKKYGFLPDGELGGIDDFPQVFNQHVLIPAMAAIDAGIRVPAAALFALAGLVGQAAEETGVTDLTGTTKGRIVRDIIGLGEATGILSMLYMPVGYLPAERRLRGKGEFDKEGRRLPTATGGPDTPPPMIPQAPKRTPAPIEPQTHPPGSIVPYHRIEDRDGGSARKTWSELVEEAREIDRVDAAKKKGRNRGESAQSGPDDGPLDKAGNINLNYIKAPEDVLDVYRVIAAANGNFGNARRNTLSWEETVEAAEALGMTPKKLSERIKGGAFNAEEIHAARQLAITSATAVHNITMKYQVSRSAIDAIKFQEAVYRHTMIQEQLAGVTAEAGRALNAFKIKVEAAAGARRTGQTIEDWVKGINDPEIMQKLVSGEIGKEKLDDLAELLARAKTPGEVSRVVRAASGAKLSDMIFEAYVNGLLSGPHTHVRNLVSNTAFSVLRIFETAGAGAIGAGRRALGGSRDSVYMEETWARLVPMLMSQKKALNAAARAFKTEKMTFGSSKFDEADRFENGHGAIPGQFGRIYRTPGRLMMASDEYSKIITYDQEIGSIAWRKALEEKLTGQARIDRIADLKVNPTKEMIEAGIREANLMTFTTKYDKITEGIAGLRARAWGLRYVFTFLRTPSNIIKEYYNRSPLVVVSAITGAGKTGRALRGKEGAVEMDRAISAALIGSAAHYASYEAARAAYEVAMANLAGENGHEAQSKTIDHIELTVAATTQMMMMAKEGRITGAGPSDPQQKALMRADGWQPNSIRVGNFYYSFSGTEPIGLMLGVAATMADAEREMTDAEITEYGTIFMEAVSTSLLDKTFFKGYNSLSSAISDPDYGMQRYLESLATSFVPAIVGSVTRAIDPTMRDAEGVREALMAKIPVLSGRVLPRIDIWGETMVYGGSLGPNVLSPIYESKAAADPLNLKILALGAWPARVSDSIAGVELIGKEKEDWQRILGRKRRKYLSKIMTMSLFNDTMATGTKRYAQKVMIDTLDATAMDEAKAAFMATHSDYNARLKARTKASILDPDSVK